MSTEWISVKESLPSFGEPVLVWVAAGIARDAQIVISVLENLVGQHTIWHGDSPIFDERKVQSLITHWMPLPRGPRQKVKR